MGFVSFPAQGVQPFEIKVFCPDDPEIFSLVSALLFSAERLKIITPLKDTEGKEGQEVVLNCEVNTEGAKAKWLKNDDTIFESSKYVITQRDNVFSLRIKDVQKGDESNYSINLTNQRGEHAKSHCSLTIRGEWFLAAAWLHVLLCLQSHCHINSNYFEHLMYHITRLTSSLT